MNEQGAWHIRHKGDVKVNRLFSHVGWCDGGNSNISILLVVQK